MCLRGYKLDECSVEAYLTSLSAVIAYLMRLIGNAELYTALCQLKCNENQDVMNTS